MWIRTAHQRAFVLDRESVDNAMNTFDEPAVEEALRLLEAHGGSVTFMSMGPDEATDTLRKALAMAGDKDARAVLISDDALRGSDVWATALVLAAAIRKLQPDLLILGLCSDDANTGVMAPAAATKIIPPSSSGAERNTPCRMKGRVGTPTWAFPPRPGPKLASSVAARMSRVR